jgi:hypothetical protein
MPGKLFLLEHLVNSVVHALGNIDFTSPSNFLPSRRLLRSANAIEFVLYYE